MFKMEPHIRSYLDQVLFLIVSPFFMLLFLARMALFALLVAPGFFRWSLFYNGPSHRRLTWYGKDSIRQSLDVFVPHPEPSESDENALRPVVIFFPPGGWILHFKYLGLGLARCLTSRANVVVVTADYRAYPFAGVPGQVRDIKEAIAWTQNNIEAVARGDPNQIVVVGESAGGHLAWNLLYRKAFLPPKQHHDDCDSDDDDLDDDSIQINMNGIKGFVGIATPFDLRATIATFARHGLPESFVRDWLFAKKSEEYNPFGLVQQYNLRNEAAGIVKPDPSLLHHMPPMQLICGTQDISVPMHYNLAFRDELKKAGVENAHFVRWLGAHHTYQVLGYMGGDDGLSQQVLACLEEWTQTSNNNYDSVSSRTLRKRFSASDIQITPIAEPMPACPHLLLLLGTLAIPL